MNRKNLPLLLAVCVLPIAVFFFTRGAKENLRRIPEKRLWMQTLDTTNGLRTPWGAPVGFPGKNRGTATLACPKFLVRFPGESFLGDGVSPGFIGGDYRVDERYGGLFPPDSDPLVIAESSGVTYSYLSSTRTMTITFKSHRLLYRHFQNTLEIGGQKFSTAPDFLALSIEKNGSVRRVTLPDVPLAALLKSYGVQLRRPLPSNS